MEQYSYLFPIMFIIWILLIAIRIGMYLDSKAKKSVVTPLEVPQKVCPMHDWKWTEQPGMENVVYMWCQRCKKTPRQVSEGN